LTTPQCAQ